MSRRRSARFRRLAALLLLGAGQLRADVRCAAVFGDHMVLQQGRPVLIWGTGTPDERLTLEFAGQTCPATVGPDGSWRVRLAPLRASRRPETLILKASNTLRLSDVLVGEVWLCSGQSNMEKPLGLRTSQKPTDHYEDAIRAANHPLLRLYQFPHLGNPDPNGATPRWVACTPETVVRTNFSAAGYYFGAEIQRDLNVPVGLIESCFGGTRIEQWTAPEAFSHFPGLAAFAAPARAGASFDGVAASGLYRTMIAPLAPYALRGVAWYQGESNVLNADTSVYTDKMRALVSGWRGAWGVPGLPFLYVEVAPFRYSTLKDAPKPITAEELPVFWEAQARALTIPHTSMVVTTDLAHDVEELHPTDKLDVGLRLARLALTEVYGRRGPLARSPSFKKMRPRRDGSVDLIFRDTGGALASADGRPLAGFSIAGADRKFFPAAGAIHGDTVTVRSPLVPRPFAVRFAWSEVATPNLVNATSLPAMPFRTDNWPVAVQPAPP